MCVWVFVGMVFAFYFIYNGRLPNRALFSLVALFIIPLLIYVTILSDNIFSNKYVQYTTIVVALGVTIYSIVGDYGLTRIAYSISSDTTRLECVKTKGDMEQYAIDNQENVYVYDISLAFPGDPFATYEKGKPYNLLFWGGSTMYSPPYFDQLEANGLNDFYSDSFFDKGIFFMASEEPDEDLLTYMQNEFSDSVSTEIVYREEEFIVYRFIR